MNKLNTKNINNKLIFKYFFTFLLIIILFNAEIYKSTPFATALIFALMWTGFNVYIVSTEYLLTSLAFNLSLENLYISITIVFVLLLFMLYIKSLSTL